MMIQDLKRPHGVELLAAEILAPTNGNPNVSTFKLFSLSRLFASTQVAMQVGAMLSLLDYSQAENEHAA